MTPDEAKRQISLIAETSLLISKCLKSNGIHMNDRQAKHEHFENCLVCRTGRTDIEKGFALLKEFE